MSIVRGERPESGWYALDKRISEDDRLSWAARGLLVFLLGKPDNWRVSVEHLRRQTATARVRTGRDGVYALLQELQGCGYMVARQARNDDGTVGPVEYLVREVPAPLPAEPDTAPPLPAEPYPAGTTLTKTETSPRTEGKQGARKRALPGEEFPTPEWVPRDAWLGWLESRRKKPPTTRALELALETLTNLRAGGDDPRKVLDQSTLRGWTGLFTTRDRGFMNGSSSSGGRESEAQRVERINREHDDRERAAAG